MPHAIRFLAVLACALVTSCGGPQPYYRIEWSLPRTVTLAPGESSSVPIAVQRVAENPGAVHITFEPPPAGVTLTPAEFSIPEGQDSATTTVVVAADATAPLQSVSTLVMVAQDPTNDMTAGARLYLALLAPPAPQPDFSLTVEPRQVDLYAGQRRPVTVTLARAAEFTGTVTLSLDSPTASLRAEPITLNGDQTTGTLYVNVDGMAALVPVTARVVATAEDGRQATTGLSVNIR